MPVFYLFLFLRQYYKNRFIRTERSLKCHFEFRFGADDLCFPDRKCCDGNRGFRVKGICRALFYKQRESGRICQWPAGSMQRGTENGSYVLPGYIPEANDRVKIEVETDYGALTGEVQVPSPSPIVAIDTQRVASSTSDQGFFDLSVALTIEKETGKTTWYMLTIQGFSEYRKGDITLFRPFAPIVVHDGVRFYEYEWIGNRGNYWYEYTWGYGTIPSDAFYLSTYLFTDHTWNRPDLVQFILKNCFPSYEGEDYSYLSRYRFQLSAVSESYYLYMKSKIYRQNKRIFWEKPVYGNRSLPIPMWKEGMD